MPRTKVRYYKGIQLVEVQILSALLNRFLVLVAVTEITKKNYKNKLKAVLRNFPGFLYRIDKSIDLSLPVAVKNAKNVRSNVS